MYFQASQTNTSIVARGISMVLLLCLSWFFSHVFLAGQSWCITISVSYLPFLDVFYSSDVIIFISDTLFAAFGGVIPIDGLYTQDGAASLGTAAGLRQEYRFGITNYCAYVNANAGACGRQSVASKFRPYSIITSDMPLNYSQFSYAVIPPSAFRDDDSLGSFTRTASYMLLLGFVFIGLSLIMFVFVQCCWVSINTNNRLIQRNFQERVVKLSLSLHFLFCQCLSTTWCSTLDCGS